MGANSSGQQAAHHPRDREPRTGDGRSHRTRRIRRRVLVSLALIIVAALGVGACWMWWPLESWPTFAGLLAAAEQWRHSPWAPFIALAAFAVGGVVVFPINLTIAATIIVFGPVFGSVYALAGSLLSAGLVHEIGRLLPAATALRYLGARGERLRQRIVGHGIIAVAVVRLLPVAPYSLISLLSGIARIPRAHHLIGTTFGMLPGIALYALFVDRARAVLRDPHPLAWLALGGVIVLLAGMALALRAWHRRTAAREKAP